MLGSFFGKYVMAGVGVLGLVGVMYVGWLTIQIKDQENIILQQEHTILTQDGEIQALELSKLLQQAANETLNDRLIEGEEEQRQLTMQLDFILSRDLADDGPVAPVLDDLLRKGKK